MLPLTDPLWEKLDSGFNDRQDVLDCYRSLIAMYEDPSRPVSAREQNNLPRYKEILAIEPVNDEDLQKIKSTRVEFFSALPRISALCERALLESIEDDLGVETFLLSGIAAAERLLGLSRLLNFGTEGRLRCAACDWSYDFVLYDDRIAIYADPPPGSQSFPNERMMLDYHDKAPSRADGFIIPAAPGDVSDARALRLLALAERTADPQPGLLLRNFLGHIPCCKCGARAAIEGNPWRARARGRRPA